MQHLLARLVHVFDTGLAEALLSETMLHLGIV